MTQYLNLYVWQFGETAFQAYPLVLGASVVLMFLLVGPLHKRLGKPLSAAGGAVAALAIIAVPYGLLLLGAWPTVGSTVSTVSVMAFMLFANTASIVAIISATSMVAEIVEAFEERTGKRAEGTFYSGNWLVQKCATGGGIMLTGLVISLIGLEPGTPQAEVDPGVAAELALLYLGALGLLTLAAAFWLARFPITREQHEARVAAREAREATQTEAPGSDLRPGIRPGARRPAERPQTG
jgi:GPH family glycoside/pentoside/hexuronide:cation symporter